MSYTYKLLQLLCLFLVATLTSSREAGSFSSRRHASGHKKPLPLSPHDEPGYDLYVHALTSLMDISSYIVEEYSTVMDQLEPGEGELWRESMLDLLGDESPRVDNLEQLPENTTCNVCQALLGTLMALVRNGTEWADVKNATMQICYRVVPVEGWNPDTLCEPILETYAPHVIHVLKTTPHDAHYVCQFYNFCPGGVPPPSGMPKFPAIRNRNQKTEERKHKSGFKRPIRMLHVTDVHIDHKYHVGAPVYCDMPLCCRENSNGTGEARYWGDYECNIPPYTADMILSHILNEFSPDLIAYTGDTPQHTVWDQPLDETIESDRWFTSNLYHFFPGIPTYFALGNHDVTPTNQFYNGRAEVQELTSQYFTHWQRLAKLTASDRETFERNLYYTALPFPGLRVLCYNSLYGAMDNFYSVLIYDEPDYAEMLRWMNDTLALAEANNEKVIMLGHHPTGGSLKMPGYNRFINDLQAHYSETVILHLLGHNHDDKFAIVRDYATGFTRGVQISSPSMTSYTDTNPSIRMFYLDPETYLPLDMETYRIDLNIDGSSGNPPLRLTYSMTGDYGMTDATAESFDLLTSKLEMDDEFYDFFMYNVDTATGFDRACTGTCKAGLLCDLRNADSELRQKCRSNIP